MTHAARSASNPSTHALWAGAIGRYCEADEATRSAVRSNLRPYLAESVSIEVTCPKDAQASANPDNLNLSKMAAAMNATARTSP